MGAEYSCCDRMKDEEFDNNFKYRLKIHKLNTQIDELQYDIDNKNDEIKRLNKIIYKFENQNIMKTPNNSNADIEISGSKTMVL